MNLQAEGDPELSGLTLRVGDLRETYDTSGRLIQLTWLNGYTQSFTWANDQITGADSFGANFVLKHVNGQVSQLLVDGLAQASYSYGAGGLLEKVTWADGTSRQYLYDGSYLTGIIDENGQRYATWQYDANGKGLSSEHGEMGADKYSFNYRAGLTTDITGPLGLTSTYRYLNVLGVYKHADITRDGQTATMSYDAQGNRTSYTDFGGNKTLYSYNNRNLETSRTEAAGTPQARTITTDWHASFRLPTKITEPNRVTEFTYDNSGNLTQKTVTAGSLVRTWKWTYGNFGLLASATDPNGKITRYAYDAQGNLQSITNPLNQLTQFSGYDGHGRPSTIKDHNNQPITLGYTARGWLKSRTVGGETTSYDYDGVGQLTKVTFPDGRSIRYSYDSAHRLTDIADGQGNTIHYTLDLMGNRTREDVSDPAGMLNAALRLIDQSLKSPLPTAADAA